MDFASILLRKSCVWGYQLNPEHFSDRHHFDNPVYSTAQVAAGGGGGGPTSQQHCHPPGRGGLGAAANHLPLNNRVINNFSGSASSTGGTIKKHVNIEREKLAAMASNHPYHNEEDTEDEVQDRGKLINSTSSLTMMVLNYSCRSIWLR